MAFFLSRLAYLEIEIGSHFMNVKFGCLFTFVTVVSSAFSCFGEDWPTFRGIGRDAVSSETNLLDNWASDGPQLLWTAVGAGRGYASPAIAAGRAYTLGDGLSTAVDSDEYLTCFDLKTGSQLWMTKTGEAWNSGRESWQGSRGTPTVDGDMVYVITPYGMVIAVRTADGSIIWQKSLKDDLGGKKKDGWGYSESPLVDGAKLICTPGGPKATVVALDKRTGETVWTCVRPDDVGAGHSSVVIANVEGRKVYVQNTGGGPLGMDAETGELLWDYDMEPPTAFIPTPIVENNYVFSVAGYKRGGALLQQIPGSGGAVSIKEIYGVIPELGNKHGGVVLVDGYLYAGGEDKNILYGANLMTGEILWKERGAGSGSVSVLAADNKLIVRFQDGTVALAKFSPEGYQEMSSFKTPGSGDSERPSWAHPVLSDGKLYLREGDAILCYLVGKEG